MKYVSPLRSFPPLNVYVGIRIVRGTGPSDRGDLLESEEGKSCLEIMLFIISTKFSRLVSIIGLPTPIPSPDMTLIFMKVTKMNFLTFATLRGGERGLVHLFIFFIFCEEASFVRVNFIHLISFHLPSSYLLPKKLISPTTRAYRLKKGMKMCLLPLIPSHYYQFWRDRERE